MENIVIIGASRGIGKAVSLELAKKNTHIILVSRDKENLEKTKLECEEKGGSAEVFKCDLLNEQDIKGLCGHLKQIKIDIFIYNSGVVYGKDFSNMKEEEINNILNINAIVPTRLTHLLMETFEKNKTHIVYIGSIASYFFGPGCTLYFATKNYLKTFAYGVYEEFKRKGIEVLTVSPGFVATDMVFNNTKKELGSAFISTPEFVAREVVKAIEKKKRKIIVGKVNKLMIFFGRIIPSKLFGKVFYKVAKVYLKE